MVQLRQEESPEFSIRGPFGGVQSEMPLEAIENSGFADCENIMFRQGRFTIRPKIDTAYVAPLPGLVRIMDLVGTISEQNWTFDVPLVPSDSQPGIIEPLVGVADFDNADGNRIQTVFTPTRLFVYSGTAGWGAPLGYFTPNELPWRFSTAVVAQKLCFSQGLDPVHIWDGKSTTIQTTNVRVPARYLAEFNNHLILGATIENGSRAYQRIRWSAAGDPQDFTSLNSGQTDMFNDLGPINGLLKLYQQGYIFQQRGVVQAIPTGLGLKPFDFIPLSARSKGLTCPGSLAAFGENRCYYVGKDNIYAFDGTSSQEIGDMPTDGRRRLGARSRILGDIMQSKPEEVLGLVTTSVNGKPFSAYWIIIPGISIWVFNIDEANWTRWRIDGKATCAGPFTLQTAVRIMDLIGTIAEQMWAPITLTNNNPFDSVMIGMNDGTLGIFDFSGICEKDAWITTGQIAMGDYRHEKQVIKLRSVTQDEGVTTVTYSMTNEKGQRWERKTTNGSGTGLSRPDIYAPNLPGSYFTLRVDVPAGNHFSCSELALIYNTAGEIRMDAKTPPFNPTSNEASQW
jgi:hypothetical protein